MTKTSGRCTVSFHFAQPLHILCLNHPQFFICIFPVIFLAFEKEPVNHCVLWRIKENALRRCPVSSCPSCFLIVIFHALRHIIVQHITDIGLVDSHTECIGGNHHFYPVIDKIFLACPPCLRTHACMVSSHLKSRVLQIQIQFIHAFPCGTVNNPAVFPMLFHISADVFFFILCILHFKVKIFPVKSGYCLEGILHLQRHQNILPYPFRSRSGKCGKNRAHRKLSDKVKDPYIAWPEVLPPLRDTVGLVHSYHGNLCMTGKIKKAGRFQPLRRCIDDLIPA